MSYVNKDNLRGILDPTLSFFNTTLAFTTSVLTIDTLTQYGAYIHAFRIVNNDAANQIQYRTVSPTDVLKTIPPSTALDDSGWESFVQITPNAVTGTGFIELELVSRENALKPELAAMLKQTIQDQNTKIIGGPI